MAPRTARTCVARRACLLAQFLSHCSPHSPLASSVHISACSWPFGRVHDHWGALAAIGVRVRGGRVIRVHSIAKTKQNKKFISKRNEKKKGGGGVVHGA